MTGSWVDLFHRGAEFETDHAAVTAALGERRSLHPGSGTDTDSGTGGLELTETDPSPARVVADADVLAADLLVGGAAREALDDLWRHTWTTLVASQPLLEDTTAVIATLANDDLAADWASEITEWTESVTHPSGDHPALGSAYRGGAMHVLSFDTDLTAPRTGAALNARFSISVREPAAFTTLFDPANLYSEVMGDGYPGPDRPPRSGCE